MLLCMSINKEGNRKRFFKLDNNLSIVGSCSKFKIILDFISLSLLETVYVFYFSTEI